MRSPDDLEIVAFERGPHTSYSACGLPYLAGRVIEDEESLVVRSPNEFREKQSIDARVRNEVLSIDLANRQLRVAELDSDREFDEPFDLLLIATGTEPFRPPIEGIDAPGVFGLGTLQSGIDFRRALDTDKPERAVIVGGGYIGLEVAEALATRGIATSLVEAEEQPMKTLDGDMGAHVADALRNEGVEVFLDEMVEGIEVANGKVSAVVTSGRSLPAEVVVLGLGTRPEVDLAKSAGLRIGESGAIWVDDHMRSSQDGVWAAGDCAEQIHRVTTRPVNFHLGTIANKMGRVAGINIGGGDAAFPGVVGTAITKVFDSEIARTGLSSKEAAAAGFDFVAAVTRSRTKAHYYPGSERLHVKVLAARESGRFLGAQIVGAAGAGKRIDVFAAALWNRMTVHDMMNMDLSYVPPLSTVWDPVLVAARRAFESL
jgi:NADPH-dependent 2,4-dienoyl-CoA reductase/sulfur reductase-like enzyme